MNIRYPDNSMLTIHEDNTKIFTFPNHLKYLVEHDSKIKNYLKINKLQFFNTYSKYYILK